MRFVIVTGMSGGGKNTVMKMMEDAVILQNYGMLDVEALERYIVDELGGVIGQEYAEVKTNITFTEGENNDGGENNNGENNNNGVTGDKPDSEKGSDSVVLAVVITLGVIVVAVGAFLIVKKVYLAKRND